MNSLDFQERLKLILELNEYIRGLDKDMQDVFFKLFPSFRMTKNGILFEMEIKGQKFVLNMSNGKLYFISDNKKYIPVTDDELKSEVIDEMFKAIIDYCDSLEAELQNILNALEKIQLQQEQPQ